jgi:hypothetical protein
MRDVKLVVALAAAAAACQLHDIADALEKGRATAVPHEWPYAAACAAYANVTEETWCGPGVRNSSGLSALNAWSGGGYGAYRVAEECGAPLPQCFRRGDSAAVDDDDGRSPDSVLFGAPRFGARLPARFGDGRSAESEELLSIDGSAPTSPV